MDSTALFDSFDRLLDEEKDAIRRLDGAKVDDIAHQKLSMMDELVKLPSSELVFHAKRVKTLQQELRQNGLLLVHAKGVLKDVLRIKGAELAERMSFGPPRPMASSRPRLSVRG